MIVPGSANPLLLAQAVDPLDEFGRIDRSVRNRRAAGAYWGRTFTASSNLTTWTLRLCCRRADIVNYLRLFGIGNDSNSVSQHSMTMNGAGGTIQFFLGNAGGSTVALVDTAASRRDPEAHCDLQFVWDTTNATASERLRIYVDGVRQSAGSATYPAQNTTGLINSNVLHRLGALSASTSQWFDGYLSHVAFVDGQALDPSAFGLTHPRTGQWRPRSKAAIRAAVAAGGGARGGWGTNGFFLPFDDATSLTTLGYDRSQSDTDTTGNNWTATNVSLTAGATYDSTLDTPTSVFCTLNPAVSGAAGISAGALSSGTTAVRGTQDATQFSTYWEVTAGGSGVTAGTITESGATHTTTVTANKTFAFEYDAVVGKLKYRNVTDAGAWTDLATGLSGARFPYGTGAAASWNFGQQPLVGTPEAGFKALCTKNLPLAGGAVATSGSFTGNVSTDGPFIWCNGSPETLAINGNAVTWGTHADRLANGFKLRTSSASYNASGTNNWEATVLSPPVKSAFRHQNAKGN